MENKQSTKGIMPIALAFAIIISVVLVAITGIFWTRTPLSVSRLKRDQAINYAMAGLQEACYRFRTNWTDGGGNVWEITKWVGGTYPPVASRVVNIEGIPVQIKVAPQDVGGGLIRNKVSATVDFDKVSI